MSTSLAMDEEGSLKFIYEEQCQELNMDHDTQGKAWMQYKQVAQRYNLKADPSHWFACSLYASSRESFIPTVGSDDAVVMGNCVSLTKLLRCCKISIYEFISKMKKWQEMANLPGKFREQIELLERNFSTTFFLNKQYKDIFPRIFAYSSNDKKNPKFRSVSKCSFAKLYDLCWYLFLCVKNENHDAVDLGTSFQLLICCMNLVYINVVAENRLDLLNEDFAGHLKGAALPVDQNINAKDMEDVSIIEKLFDLADISPPEGKKIQGSMFKTIMEGFFDSNTIYGDRESFLGIISNENFDRNWKSLNSSYEQYILSVGTFDERLLLNKRNTPISMVGIVDEAINNFDARQPLTTMSPDASYTPKRGGIPENARKLWESTQNFQPSEHLRIADEATLKKINEKLSAMTKQLFSHLPNVPDNPNPLKMITALYYRLLENIIRVEVKNKPHIDPKILLDTDSFHTTLIICCAEIVLDSFNFEYKFPSILSCFKVDAFNFYRIIELVVGRHDAQLTRMHIRHLNSIEESCLESLSWQSSSALWEMMPRRSEHLPAWIDVDANTERTGSVQHTNSPITGSIQHTNSPINSAFETFSAVPTNDTARRDLFNTSRDNTNDTSRGTRNERLRSLNIFFRKFYKLAWLRIREFCKELNMDNDSCLKIWTLFEYSIIQCIDLMRDRHLDQIIMCAIYIYIRVTEHQNNKFTDIMKAYRKQPQAVSSTYREVLIESESNNENGGEPAYNDLIYFYNNIYVKAMTPYAYGFSRNNTRDSDLLLSPHPSERQNAPKKISSSHKIFVSPMESSNIRHSPDSLIYGIGSSPAKDLQRMNDVVKRGKRNLPFNEDSSPNCKESRLSSAYITTIQGVLNDRHTEPS